MTFCWSWMEIYFFVRDFMFLGWVLVSRNFFTSAIKQIYRNRPWNLRRQLLNNKNQSEAYRALSRDENYERWILDLSINVPMKIKLKMDLLYGEISAFLLDLEFKGDMCSANHIMKIINKKMGRSNKERSFKLTKVLLYSSRECFIKVSF